MIIINFVVCNEHTNMILRTQINATLKYLNQIIALGCTTLISKTYTIGYNFNVP